jgi:hypothetical protein
LISPGAGTYSPAVGSFEIMKQQGSYIYGIGLKNESSPVKNFGSQNRFKS